MEDIAWLAGRLLAPYVVGWLMIGLDLWLRGRSNARHALPRPHARGRHSRPPDARKAA